MGSGNFNVNARDALLAFEPNAVRLGRCTGLDVKVSALSELETKLLGDR
jgi:hypothetical protein